MTKCSADDRIERILERLKHDNLLRHVVDSSPVGNGRTVIDGRQFVDFCSNDYLGLAQRSVLADRACASMKQWGVGSTAARLLSGSRPDMSVLEERLARVTGKDASLLFNSGYHANTGAITALTDENSVILSDEMNHASIIDGCRLSRAKTVIYPHGDTNRLERFLTRMEKSGELKRDTVNLLVTEGVFSMDGDVPDREALLYLKDRFGLLLYLDDAHGFGCLGREGKGSFERYLSRVDVLVATFGKALGVFGAFAASSRPTVELLKNRARSFIYSTALPPAIPAAVDGALEIVASAEGRSLRSALAERASYFRSSLQKAGLDTGRSVTHIVPVVLGDEARTFEVSRALFDAGVFCRGIRYPTVAIGAARVRFSLSASHGAADLAFTLESVSRICNGTTERD